MFFLCNSLFRASVHRSRKSNAYAPAPPQTAFFNADIAYKDAANIAFLCFLATPPHFLTFGKAEAATKPPQEGFRKAKSGRKPQGAKKFCTFATEAQAATRQSMHKSTQAPTRQRARACTTRLLYIRKHTIIYRQTQTYIQANVPSHIGARLIIYRKTQTCPQPCAATYYDTTATHRAAADYMQSHAGLHVTPRPRMPLPAPHAPHTIPIIYTSQLRDTPCPPPPPRT